MRLVYPVAWGQYEDYATVAVFSTPEQAAEFVRVANEREPLWGLYVDHRPLQLCESSAEVASIWPMSGELPEWPVADRDDKAGI